MNKPAVKHITEKHGGAIMSLLDVKERSLREARSNGFFPASWWSVIKTICDDSGEECPEDAFNFKSPKEQVGMGG